jgi:hypothetical protein
MIRTMIQYRIRIATIARAAAPPATLAFAATTLILFPPTHYNFYPPCPIHECLQLQCPGCGATRALAALLHGQVAEAIHFNALFTLLLPFIAAYGILCYHRFLQHKPLRWPPVPPGPTYTALAATIIFTVTRNLPLHSL